jgi:hypothetical protein
MPAKTQSKPPSVADKQNPKTKKPILSTSTGQVKTKKTGIKKG